MIDFYVVLPFLYGDAISGAYRALADITINSNRVATDFNHTLSDVERDSVPGTEHLFSKNCVFAEEFLKLQTKCRLSVCILGPGG